MADYDPQGRPSLIGALTCKMIACVVRAAGGDILAVAKKYGQPGRRAWHPPRNWHFEKIDLQDGARAHYLVPPGCTRTDAAILHLHGGGYTIGFLPAFQRRSAKLARLGGLVPVLSLDYRVAPEHRYPAALEDVCKAVDWLAAKKGIQPASVIAIGESAGAGLALALALWQRDHGRGRLRALVLMSPWADLTGRSQSFTSRYTLDPMFGGKRPPLKSSLSAPGQVYAGGHDLRDPYLSPVFGEYTGLPPMLIHVGEYEMLYDDAVTVHGNATAAGVPAEIKVWAGMFHAFQIADAMVPEARRAWREIGAFMRRHLER
jgi:epsilon-lactone hydrolase